MQNYQLRTIVQENTHSKKGKRVEHMFIFGLTVSAFAIYFWIFHLWFEGLSIQLQHIRDEIRLMSKDHIVIYDKLFKPEPDLTNAPKEYFKKMGWDSDYVIRRKGPMAGPKSKYDKSYKDKPLYKFKGKQ